MSMRAVWNGTVLAESDKAIPKAINPKIEMSNDQGLTKGKNGCRLLEEKNLI